MRSQWKDQVAERSSLRMVMVTVPSVAWAGLL